MKRKRFLCFMTLVVIILQFPLYFFPIQSSALTINDSTFFLKEEYESGTCTLVSAAMLLRRSSYLKGDSDWSSVTKASVRSTVWDEANGLFPDFTYKGIHIKRASFNGSQNDLINILKEHPEGIVAYRYPTAMHAVLLTDYDYSNGIFYAADPADNFPSGRIPLTSCYSVRADNINYYWYVVSPKFDRYDPPPNPEWKFDINNAPKCSSTYWLGRGTVGGVTGTTTGDDVKWLQTALNKTINAGLTVDGILGSGTETAIENFQKKNGLTVDGYAGVNTINKLVELLKNPDAPKIKVTTSFDTNTSKHVFTVTWNKISNANNYIINFGIEGTSASSKKELGNVLSHTDSSLSKEKVNNYGKTIGIWFKVKAVSSNGSTSDWSNTYTVYISPGCYGTHNYGSWATSKVATCTADGTQTRKCSICGNTESKTIPKTGHSLGAWTTSKNATCTADGTQVRKCNKCSYSESKTIAKTEHSLGAWTTSKDATCTADGTQVRKCSKCSYSESKTIAKTGHSLGNWTTSKNATCIADGTQVRKCSKCSYTEEKAIAKTGHKYTDKIVAPTCTEKGYTLHTCSFCNDSYKDNETNSKGHAFTSKMIDGYMTYVCSDCGYMYTAPFEGEGTAESPFIISNADELRAVSETVNNTEINQIFGHAYYKQTVDIDLENISWTPIGLGYDGKDGRGAYNCTTRMFFGVYNGNQHTIYNLNVENYIEAGLFGCVRNDGAEVCNLIVYGNINSDGDSGGITGGLHYGAKIIKCAFIGDVKGNLSIGGIAGYINGGASIINCYHNGNVTGGNNMGGIVGEVAFNQYANNNASTIIENCYQSNGEVIGACYYAIVGNCKYYEGKNNIITIKNCYSTYTGGGSAVIIPLGSSYYSDTHELSVSQMKKIAEDLGEAYIDNTNPELNNGFPVFPWQLDIMLKGDADNNGVVDVNDAVMLQEWLLGASTELTNWENVDLCEDGRIDVFDFCLLKKLLMEW